MEEFTPAEYQKFLNDDGDFSLDNLTDEEKTTFHLLKLMYSATESSNARVKCFSCNGTGWQGQFECFRCKGTGGL